MEGRELSVHEKQVQLPHFPWDDSKAHCTGNLREALTRLMSRCAPAIFPALSHILSVVLPVIPFWMNCTQISVSSCLSGECKLTQLEHLFQAIQPHSLCSFLLCHPPSTVYRSLLYIMEELKSSVSSNLVPELHKLDQKSLGENSNCFFTKRKITFFIYKTTEMFQT